MNRIPITPNPDDFPAPFRELLVSSPVFDSSCSDTARVFFVDRDGGLFLKTAPKGALKAEAQMTSFFHGKGLSAPVLAYHSVDADWLLTARVPGEDCTHAAYLENPQRLCDTLAQILRLLHSRDFSGCPIAHPLPADMEPVLIHGDFCLPNVMLNRWQFSGLIDLGGAGIGDRHEDLYWAIWSLGYNLKTDRYRDRFLDAYGREYVDPHRLRAVAAAAWPDA